MEVEDPSSGKTYWYNTKTQQTTFENPSAAGAASPAAPAPAPAATSSVEASDDRPKVSRMGGMLDAYKDINKGFSMYKPTGWNQFEAVPGQYDVKWEVLF